MKSNTGYRTMLRDRIPKVVDFALKWCKVKEAWLDHAYKNWIWIYQSKEERLKATKRLIGNKSNPFNFEDTIDWENLDQQEEARWKSVSKWVSWFQKEYSIVENEYSVSKKLGYDIVDIKRGIMLNYLYDWCPKKEDDTKTRKYKNKKINEFVDFLIDCFENS